MGARNDDGPRGTGEGPPATPGTRSRVFVWGDAPPERSVFQRMMDRLRRTERNGTPRKEPDATVFRPPVTRRAGSDAPPRREMPVPVLPDPDGGWEPPDLTVDEPVEAEPSPEPEHASAPPPDAGHGPGPLYRATLQLLPGRLQPLDPDIVREEIRFVRPSGRDAVVTLGWADGEPPDHITVNHPSVHDRHARMSFVDRRWRIESLVDSHPVHVNGEALPVGAEPWELQSGDEVRLGDASFHFRMP